jgi:hypothetical protein
LIRIKDLENGISEVVEQRDAWISRYNDLLARYNEARVDLSNAILRLEAMEKKYGKPNKICG